MTNYADKWTPNGPFGIVTDTDIEGGFHVVADDTARDSIPLLRQKVGMHVFVVATTKLWRLTVTGVTPTYVEVVSAGTETNFVGGYRSVANLAARNAIPTTQQKVGMLVLQLDTLELWRLTAISGPPGMFVRVLQLTVADTITLSNILLDGQLQVSGATLGTGGIVDYLGATRVEALASPVGRSFIGQGCELMPALESLLPDYGPAATLHDGKCVSANGRMVEIDGGPITGDSADRIGGGSFPAGPATVYFFVRGEGGDPTDPRLKFHTSPPDIYGQPASAEVGYVVGDYCYVGALRYLDTSAADWNAVWGQFAVSHPATGVREILLDIKTDTSMETSSSVLQASGSTTVRNCGPITNLSTLFPTAQQIIMSFELMVVNGTGGTVILEARAPGLKCGADISAGDRVISSVIARVPNRAERLRVEIYATGGYAGTETILSRSAALGIIENLNQALPILQTDLEP